MEASFTGEDLRRIFIEFFQNKYQHTFVRSSSVVPHDDPTLLFTNAGMNQVCFKLDHETAVRHCLHLILDMQNPFIKTKFIKILGLKITEI